MALKNPNDVETSRPSPPASETSYYGEALTLGNFSRELQTYWFLLLNKLWLIGGIVLCGMILTASYLVATPKLFTAKVTVQVELHDQSEINLKNTYPDALTGLEQLNTIVGKFEGRPLLAAVLFQAGLISSNSLAGITTTAAMNHPVADDQAKADLKLINAFEKHVKVALRRNTRLIDIAVTDRDPVQAAKLANLLVENYLKQDFSLKSTTGKTVSEFFKTEYDRLAQQVQKSEQELQDYAKSVGTVQLADPKNEELTEYQRQLTVAKADAIRCQSAYDKSLAMGTNVDELLAYTAIASDPQIQSYQTAMAQKEAELMQLKQQYREKNPKYILAVNTLEDLKAQFDRKVLTMRDQIQESFRLPYENAAKTVTGLAAELAKSQVNSLDLSQQAIRYNVLAQKAKADREMFEAVSQRLNEMTVSSQLAPAGISVVVPASPPNGPSAPKTQLLLGLGFFGFLGLGIFLVLILDSFNTALRTVDTAEKYLNLPVLGAFPQLDFDHRDHHNQLVAARKNAKSAEVELFRTLRASLLMLGKDDRRSFVFTSSFANEGKTFTACNFAASLAQQGLRTIVLDLDLRRPRVEKFFSGEIKSIPGVTEVLEHRLMLSDVAQSHPEAPNLFWVSAGSTAQGRAEWLSQGVFKNLLDQALLKYDRVVIDTPPLHPVKDALMIAHEVSTVITLVDARRTARRAVAKTIQWLRNVDAPVVGVVLNRLPHRHHGKGFFYHEYYGYGYGNYGQNDKSAADKS